MEKYLLKKLVVVIMIAVLVGVGFLASSTEGALIFSTGSSVSEGVDDPAHPGIENRHNWEFANFSNPAESFSEVRVEEPDMDSLIYRIDVPEGWTYLLDSSGIIFNSTDPAYDILTGEGKKFSVWTPGYSLDKVSLDVAVAKTRTEVFTNHGGLHVPQIPEPAALVLLSLGGFFIRRRR